MKQVTLPDDHNHAISLLLEKLTEAMPHDFDSQYAKTVLHIGAHKGEEVLYYEKYDFNEIFLVEANPELAAKLKQEFRHNPAISVITQAVSNTVGTAEFFIHTTNKGSVESASLLPLKKLAEIVPVFNSNLKIEVETNTLDEMFKELNFQTTSVLLCLDIQGAELLALAGAKALLNNIKAIICEVNLIENYAGCALEIDIENVLSSAGFERYFTIYHELYDEQGTFPAWGEGLWIKKSVNN